MYFIAVAVVVDDDVVVVVDAGGGGGREGVGCVDGGSLVYHESHGCQGDHHRDKG